MPDYWCAVCLRPMKLFQQRCKCGHTIDWEKGNWKTMNAKQSLKAASKHIDELETVIIEQDRLLNMYKADVKNFYECIEGTVDGKSICDWCDAYKECQLQEKGGKGCKEWEHILQQQEEGKDES